MKDSHLLVFLICISWNFLIVGHMNAMEISSRIGEKKYIQELEHDDLQNKDSLLQGIDSSSLVKASSKLAFHEAIKSAREYLSDKFYDKNYNFRLFGVQVFPIDKGLNWAYIVSFKVYENDNDKKQIGFVNVGLILGKKITEMREVDVKQNMVGETGEISGDLK